MSPKKELLWSLWVVVCFPLCIATDVFDSSGPPFIASTGASSWVSGVTAYSFYEFGVS